MDAWRLTRRLLVVSALIGDAATNAPDAVPLNDGVLTRRNTFQRYFGQKELQQYIEDALDVPAVPVAVGIFYVFSNPTAHELFVQSRSRRKVVWKDLGIDLALHVGFENVIAPARVEKSRRPRFDPSSLIATWSRDFGRVFSAWEDYLCRPSLPTARIVPTIRFSETRFALCI